jgi:hypothetical protein
MARHLFLAWCLAMLTVFISVSIGGRTPHRAETIGQQEAILAGRHWQMEGKDQYLPEYQNRVLFPLLLRVGTSLGGMTGSRWYLLLRLATCFGMFLAAGWSLGREDAVTGSALLALGLLPTFDFPWENPCDFLDAAYFFLLAAAVAGGRKGWAVALTALAAANRESAAFAGVIWIIVRGEIAFGAALTGMAGALVVALRYALGGPEGLRRQMLGIFAVQPGLVWPLLLVAMFGPALVWAANQKASRKWLAAAGAVGAISAIFGIASEARVFIPSLALVLFSARGRTDAA